MEFAVRLTNCFIRRVLAVVALIPLFMPGHAQAAVIWNWSFGDTEAGTFTTDGTFADTSGAGSFAITNFTVTSSTVTALVGQPYLEFQPTQGFAWNGGSPTQFYRNSGSLTNGSNFYVTDPGSNTYGYLFFANSTSSLGRLTDPTQTTIVGFSPLTLTPTAVPEPSTWVTGMGGLAVAALHLARRRRA